mmetsp:Transcript_33440/g.79483  ORF Transcript_33440/g.79483 Transcript_33440/m.79483 type:complete len:398 (+) Transcript_33440:3-1196(+)
MLGLAVVASALCLGSAVVPETATPQSGCSPTALSMDGSDTGLSLMQASRDIHGRKTGMLVRSRHSLVQEASLEASQMSSGAIVGIAVAVPVVLALLCCLAYAACPGTAKAPSLGEPSGSAARAKSAAEAERPPAPADAMVGDKSTSEAVQPRAPVGAIAGAKPATEAAQPPAPVVAMAEEGSATAAAQPPAPVGAPAEAKSSAELDQASAPAVAEVGAQPPAEAEQPPAAGAAAGAESPSAATHRRLMPSKTLHEIKEGMDGEQLERLEQVLSKKQVEVDEENFQLKFSKPLEFEKRHHGASPTATFKDEAQVTEMLKDLVQVLELFATAEIDIEGHTSTPDAKLDAWSRELAFNRAMKVKDALEALGIRKARMKARGRPGKFGTGKSEVVFRITHL